MESSGMILRVSVKQCIRPESVKKRVSMGPATVSLPSCHKEEYPLNCHLHILLKSWCWKSYSKWARRILQLAWVFSNGRSHDIRLALALKTRRLRPPARTRKQCQWWQKDDWRGAWIRNATCSPSRFAYLEQKTWYLKKQRTFAKGTLSLGMFPNLDGWKMLGNNNNSIHLKRGCLEFQVGH